MRRYLTGSFLIVRIAVRYSPLYYGLLPLAIRCDVEQSELSYIYRCVVMIHKTILQCQGAKV